MRSLTRFGLLVLVLGFVGGIVFWSVRGSAGEVMVYKSPACGCCKDWVKHLRDHGFTVKTQDVADVTPIKAKHGVLPALASCHTALVDGYVVEGHVPADDLKRLLRERPAVAGVAVPGMPAGSPGMEGTRQDRYQVLTFDAAGRTAVYASH